MTPAFSPDVDGREPFPQSFDLSKLPNLRDVEFGVGWMGGGPPWIPKVLSTLRPATSPRLSVIKLYLTHTCRTNRSAEAVIGAAGNDLRQVADEVARIEREFKGAVGVNVDLDSLFEVVSDALKVRIHLCGMDDTS